MHCSLGGNRCLFGDPSHHLGMYLLVGLTKGYHMSCVLYDSYIKKPWVNKRRNHRITESRIDALIRVGLGKLIRFLPVRFYLEDYLLQQQTPSKVYGV